ncbi:Gfo/Idh/MocA family protein [Fimbriimonas ginsengisoli]|uniref:Dehydrogenase n=1 Tax=Fimbriimonas ginsengisoli Gsoil 348 TaxID=661478 RepID=A0A068NIQ3_FIMGI|nr:Gfo/Idh/MocA family oxidoreductase [Fimbriimonas ginsengisoli]AIE83478.1 Dehydrogenase [Fimbriimonas ginsengisoli Gsoil 348]
MTPLRVGIVGIGNISGIYFKNLGSYRSTQIVAVADLDTSRADAAAAKYGIPNSLTVDQLLAHPDVDLVLNLTIPKAHGPIGLQAVAAGKHVYNEKPLSTELESARQLVEAAKAKGLRVGCAPDTFLGAGLQTARKAIDAGEIGTPIGAQGNMLARGPEPWHPNPEFFYKPGGGPMLDMGPYYMTALVSLLGPVRRVAGLARASFPTRTVGSGALKGNVIQVETPTHFVGGLEFVQGALGQTQLSFDVYHSWADHPIVIFGSEGTMRVPDPNTFGGDVTVRRHNEEDWRVIPNTHGFAEDSRGLGVLDIAHAISENRPHRASGDLALHVLEIMLAFERSSTEGRHIELNPTIDRPAPMGETEFADDL